VGDVNGDGHLDLASVSSATDESGGWVTVLLGDGSGNFGAPTDVAVFPGIATSLAVGDLNGDGFADVVVTTYTDMSVLIGDGSGTNFTTTRIGPFYIATSVQIADLNSDNLPDLVVADEGEPGCSQCRPKVVVLFGNGAGGFSESVSRPAPELVANSVAVADLNGDGHADIVATDSLSSSVHANTVWVLLGDGAGNFPTQAIYPTGVNPTSVAVGDINSDGFPDVAVTIVGTDTVSVFLGDGTGKLGSPTDFATAKGPLSVVIGNLDGDTRPDLAVANFNSSSVSVLLKTTLPTTPPAPTILNAAAANQSATISWLTPAGDGGSPITGYVVTPYIVFDAQPSVTFSSTATTQTVTGLTNGTTYRFKVSAINAVGVGSYSQATNPVTPGP